MQGDISVIVPCFNNANSISRSLASIESQTLSPREVIVVDDRSSDNSIELISRFIKSSILSVTLIRNDKNRGPSYARNIGIRKSQGAYVAFLDADDIWLPRKLARQYTFMKETGAYLCGHLSQDEDRRTNGIVVISFSSLLHRNPFVTPSVMLKNSKEYFFDEDMRYCEDHDLWIQIARRHACFLLPDDLVILGRRPMSKGGLSSKRWEMRRGQLRIYRKLRAENAISFVKYVTLVSLSLIKHMVRIFSPEIRETV